MQNFFIFQSETLPVISSPDLKSINEEPTLYHEQGLDLAALKAAGIKNFPTQNLKKMV